MIKQILLVILILIVGFGDLPAQKLNYKKEVFPLLPSLNDMDAFQLLSEYQRQDPKSANVYYQLGKIMQKWAEQTDPLTDIQDVKYFIYNARVYYGIAKPFIDEKEVSKHDQYYAGIPKRAATEEVELSDVQADMDDRLGKLSVLEQNVLLINRYFNTSVDFYNKSIKSFMDINRKYNKIKDIYLLADSGLTKTAKELNGYFDSTLFYFQKYKTSITAFPIQSYKQQITLKTIVTYRLDGLTTTNFLKDSILLWDYGAWVQDLFKVLNADVKDIRERIIITDNSLNQSIDYLSLTKEFHDSLQYYRYPKDLVFKIGKFDHKSIIPVIFAYKQKKIEFLAKTHYLINNIADTLHQVPLLKRAKYYHEILEDKIRTDSLNGSINKCITPENVQKYRDLFFGKYTSPEFFKLQIEKDNKENSTQLDHCFAHYKKFMIDDCNALNKLKSLLYNGSPISFSVNPVDFAATPPRQYITTDVKMDNAGNFYLTGYFKTKDQGACRAFIAKTTKSEKIDWLRTYSISVDTTGNFDHAGLLVFITENGCFAMINSSVEGGKMINTLVRLNSKSDELLNVKLESDLVPRSLYYDEINEKLFLTFKGKKFDPLVPDILRAGVYCIDARATQLWRQDLKFDGNFVEMIKMDRNYLLFCNYAEYINAQGELFKSNGKTRLGMNTLCIRFNDNGEIVKMQNYAGNASFYAIKALKISSECINLIGLKGENQGVQNLKLNQVGNLYYSLINAKGECYYSNLLKRE